MSTQVRAPSFSERHSTYFDYTDGISPAAARKVLIALAVTLLLAEAAVRVVHPAYTRTAVSSLHGIRTLFQMAVSDPGPKLIAVGDSTLVGGGVYDDKAIVMGRMSMAIGGGPHVYNLAVPGGGSGTSLLLLDALDRAHVKNVDRVLIEEIPSKLLETPKSATIIAGNGEQTVDDIMRYVPYARPDMWGVAHGKQTYTDRVEAKLEYGLGNISALYRNRDYFRTQYIGNYPAFWFLSSILPKHLRAKIFGEGTNRLAARMDDFPYDPASAPPAPDTVPGFAPRAEGGYLVKAITLARALGKNPPILVLFPMHYEYEQLRPGQAAQYQTQLAKVYDYIQQVGSARGCQVIIVKSDGYQDPSLWTRTPAHFNAAGSAKVWSDIRPQICAIYSCTE